MRKDECIISSLIYTIYSPDAAMCLDCTGNVDA